MQRSTGVWRERLVGYSLAALSTALAAWTRSGLAPVLEDRVPFGFFFIAVLFTAWLAGAGPALFSLFLGIFAAAHFVIRPESSLWIEHQADQLALLLYAIGGGVSILLFQRLANQQQLAEQRALENERLSVGLQHADRRKDEFLALLAHELRNPLAPLRTGLEVLQHGSVCRQTQSETLQIMMRQLHQVTRLLDDLLDVSRYTKGQLRLKRAVVDLRHAVQIAVESTRPVIEEQSHHFHWFVPSRPVWVDGDQVRLVQTIANLLTNAAKYTPRHGRIRLHLDSQDDHATLDVVDNGIGIAAADQERIFDLFTQVDESRCREYQGLGIGLGLVRKLAQAHGGEIVVISPGAGRGSTFRVTLPLAPPAAAPEQAAPEQATPEQAAPEQATPEQATPEQATPEQATPEQAAPEQAAPEQVAPEQVAPEQVAPEQAAPEQAAAAPRHGVCIGMPADAVPGGPTSSSPAGATMIAGDATAGLPEPTEKNSHLPRVLIVDDNRDSASTLAMLLSFEGISTKTAFDGGAALDSVLEFDPEVVLLDIGMPGMDGFEVARRIRSMPGGQRRRIIAVSGWGAETLGSRVAESGFDAHRLKPVDVDALLHDLLQPQIV